MKLRLSVEYKDVFQKFIENVVVIDNHKGVRVHSNHLEELSLKDVINAIKTKDVFTRVSHISFSSDECEKILDKIFCRDKDVRWYLEDLADMIHLDADQIIEILEGLENEEFIQTIAILIDED